MGLLQVIELILGVLKFPSEVRALILLLQKTPQEKHDEVVARITKEMTESGESGRPPEWD